MTFKNKPKMCTMMESGECGQKMITSVRNNAYAVDNAPVHFYA